MSPFDVLWNYRAAFADGLFVTFKLLILSCLFGSLFGLGLELASTVFGKAFRRIVDSVAFCLSAIPALVILFWIHFPFQALLDIVVAPFWTALVTFTLLNSFAIYRIIADAVSDFPSQYLVAAKVSGLDSKVTFTRIQSPILLRTILPRWIDQQVVILHTTLFASLISVEETFRAAQRVNSVVYRPVVIYTAMALLFLVTSGPVLLIAKHLRTKVFRDLSER